MSMCKVMQHLGIAFIVCWLSVINERAFGNVLPQHPPLQLKTDINNNVEVYRDNGHGSSWLQMLFVFSRHSSNNQSTSLTEDAPCTGSEKSTVCKDGFIELQSKKCYYFNRGKSTWPNALKVCQSMVSTLAYPMCPIENTALVNHLNTKHNGTQGWWLGGTDEAMEGEWVWTHNRALMTYTDWFQGQPANANKNEHCLQYWKDAPQFEWQWNDRICTEAYPFICQQ